MAMDPERRARADALLVGALDLPVRSERPSCGRPAATTGDAPPRHRACHRRGALRRLLEVRQVLQGGSGSAHRRSFPAKVGPGTIFGSWEIVGELGAGGMAEVFLARRIVGEFEQQAASS
jgi:hypothetical protein